MFHKPIRKKCLICEGSSLNFEGRKRSRWLLPLLVKQEEVGMSVLNAYSNRQDVISATQIMRTGLVTLAPEDDFFHSVGRLLRENISGAPVVGDDGTYLGVLSEKCCISALTAPAEVASEVGLHDVRAREIMTRELITLDGDTDVFDAIDNLLSNQISGAPVTDLDGKFIGIFSEKTAMRVLASAMLDGLPGAPVSSYMNTDPSRIVDHDALLLDIAHKFQETPFRRLPVLDGERLIGQISRRDVLRGEYRMAAEVMSQGNQPEVSIRLKKAVQPKQVGDCMDTLAITATPSMDILGITQIFLNTPYRRIPIVEGTQLVGQISRRDLLHAAAEVLRPTRRCGHAETLYLSGVDATAPSAVR